MRVRGRQVHDPRDGQGGGRGLRAARPRALRLHPAAGGGVRRPAAQRPGHRVPGGRGSRHQDRQHGVQTQREEVSDLHSPGTLTSLLLSILPFPKHKYSVRTGLFADSARCAVHPQPEDPPPRPEALQHHVLQPR